MAEQNEVKAFEDKNYVLLANYALLEKQAKDILAKQKEAKADLLAQMEKYNIKSIDNKLLKITRVEPSESTSVDLKAFQKEEPVNYAQLLEDYPKVTKRKSSIRITVK